MAVFLYYVGHGYAVIDHNLKPSQKYTQFHGVDINNKLINIDHWIEKFSKINKLHLIVIV